MRKANPYKAPIFCFKGAAHSPTYPRNLKQKIGASAAPTINFGAALDTHNPFSKSRVRSDTAFLITASP